MMKQSSCQEHSKKGKGTLCSGMSITWRAYVGFSLITALIGTLGGFAPIDMSATREDTR